MKQAEFIALAVALALAGSYFIAGYLLYRLESRGKTTKKDRQP